MRKIGVNHYVLAANLNKKAGVANESNPKLSIGYEARFVRLAATRSNRRMAN
jgi:hypothetical protein